MSDQQRTAPYRLALRLAPLALVLVACATLLAPAPGQAATVISTDSAERIAAGGLGDRQNSWAWSMQWWRGHLYVGTNRAWACVEAAVQSAQLPTLFPYPPSDRDLACPATQADLPLQAEIWRYSPGTGAWQRVYQSPLEVQLPGEAGGLVARDIGFRGMAVFVEPDGSEALYVTGVSAGVLGYDAPPPRILRSADGVSFSPVPQEPGTMLGDLPWTSLRNPVVYKGRLYVIAGDIKGSGALLEAQFPAAGNDNFREVSAPDARVSVAQPFDGLLYLGVRTGGGYAIVQTAATGEPPYAFEIVVPSGGFAQVPNSEILSMVEFKGQLYAGGNGVPNGATAAGRTPAELIRVSPDGSWEVVVGNPRLTPEGWKFPLSGMVAGFGHPYNAHIWRMAVFRGQLYVGTFDNSTLLKDDPALEPLLRTTMGFDLYRTADGERFTPLTITGFGDRFNYGARSLAATEGGLFLGTANPYLGLQVWRIDRADRLMLYLPTIAR